MLSRVIRRQVIRGLATASSSTKTSSSSTDDPERLVDFGYEQVSKESKQAKVNEVFERVAERYDLMNDVMSGGLHRLWKDYFVHRAGPTPGERCLDVAGGTGDVAFRLAKYSGRENLDKALVTVCDINAAMMKVGKKRAEKLGMENNIEWVEGNAEDLPLEDNSYDLYTIAFGYRNCTDLEAVAREAHRVLAPGGRFMCLEFSDVKFAPLKLLYDQYSLKMIPVLGQLVAGDWDSYQYLVESIRRFPNQEELADILRGAGLQEVHHENILTGLVAIHSAFKL